MPRRRQSEAHLANTRKAKSTPASQKVLCYRSPAASALLTPCRLQQRPLLTVAAFFLHGPSTASTLLSSSRLQLLLLLAPAAFFLHGPSAASTLLNSSRLQLLLLLAPAAFFLHGPSAASTLFRSSRLQLRPLLTVAAFSLQRTSATDMVLFTPLSFLGSVFFCSRFCFFTAMDVVTPTLAPATAHAHFADLTWRHGSPK